MTRISKGMYIDITKFRLANNLLQKDLSDYLGVTRGYMSMVERGASKLSRTQLDKIRDNDRNWDVKDLVPAYTRILFMQEKFKEHLAEVQLYTIIAPVLEKIKYGEATITEYIADAIIKVFPGGPINKNWILSGEGDFIAIEKKKKTPVEEIQEMKKTLEKNTRQIQFLSEQILRLSQTIQKQERRWHSRK